ncbi:MAG: tetratricopeptide repeat protein [Planctomycetes bacterium]|nr:tetratricopeptide repeat protein [Planctomycetota bacterium]
MPPEHESPVAAIDRELATDPTNADARLRRGEFYYRQCHAFQAVYRVGGCGPEPFRPAFDQARRSLARAVELAPASPRAWAVKGDLLVDLEHHPEFDVEALASFDRAVALAPADARSWYQRAGVCTRMGDHAGAVVSPRQAIDLEPGYRNDASWEFPELTDEPGFRKSLADSAGG